MNASVVNPGGTPHAWGERVAVAVLAVGIVLGSALLWIGIPIAGFWVAGRITTDALTAVLFALLAIPTAMVAFGWVLYRAMASTSACGDRNRAARPRPRGAQALARNVQASAAARADAP